MCDLLLACQTHLLLWIERGLRLRDGDDDDPSLFLFAEKKRSSSLWCYVFLELRALLWALQKVNWKRGHKKRRRRRRKRRRVRADGIENRWRVLVRCWWMILLKLPQALNMCLACPAPFYTRVWKKYEKEKLAIFQETNLDGDILKLPRPCTLFYWLTLRTICKVYVYSLSGLVRKLVS